jgi:glycerophosphoryl diester phosphodiesterase
MSTLFSRPIAHRGLHDRSKGVIENTPSAFAAAIEHGYAIECDVQLSSDGVPFIFHDDEFGRLTRATGRSDEIWPLT